MYDLRKPKQRARYRRATFKRRDSNFGAAERIIRAVFKRERATMLAAIPKVGKVNKADWTKAFKQVWILAGGDAWKYSEETWGGAQRLKPQKSINPLLLHTFNYQFKAAPTPWLVHVADYIDTKGGDNITEISATTQDKVKNAIFAGVEREEGIPQIADRVAGVYDGFEGYRATMIARSEVVDASNQASLAQAREAGSTLDLMWVATLDDRTREEHAEMDGVTVAYDQEFDCSDGTTMPGEAVNCRCAIGYAVPEAPVAEEATVETLEYPTSGFSSNAEVNAYLEDNGVVELASAIRGVDQDVANIYGQTLADMYSEKEKWGLQELRAVGMNARDGVVATTDTTIIGDNVAFDLKLQGYMKTDADWAEHYEWASELVDGATRQVAGSLPVDDVEANTIIHELGHVSFGSLTDAQKIEFYRIWGTEITKQELLETVSKYSIKNDREGFAENFLLYVKGEKDRIPKDILTYLTELYG